MSGFDDRLEDEDYDLIAENTGIQLQRKKFRRVHGNVLDSDEEGEEGMETSQPQSSSMERSAVVREDSRDSMQDEDFAHVRLLWLGCGFELDHMILPVVYDFSLHCQ